MLPTYLYRTTLRPVMGGGIRESSATVNHWDCWRGAWADYRRDRP